MWTFTFTMQIGRSFFGAGRPYVSSGGEIFF